ncbi:hypothetical protein [Amycolatopsis rifamycinica]|uniref:PE domain-containing protein n=1 Tax=Amycolatopsis rifamycinica TaxID=287986 RepID=A0A066U3L6_9PSEU|nr:hypothetical protein [Amycolatopsis rifamycinica]KDN22061.1 hypothetical protein DV20_11800 [Amycolatopsis rifamycinica]
MATVRDEADARRQLRAARQHETDELVIAGPVTGSSASGGGIELHYDGVEDVKRAIDERYDELSRHLETARSLDTGLADGKGPVAHWMRRSFAVRGGAEAGGVQAALRSYLAELATLRQTLDTVVTMHQGHDEEAAAALPAGDADA